MVTGLKLTERSVVVIVLDAKFVIDEVELRSYASVEGWGGLGGGLVYDITACFAKDELLAQAREEVERESNHEDDKLIKSPSISGIFLLLLLELSLHDNKVLIRVKKIFVPFLNDRQLV